MPSRHFPKQGVVPNAITYNALIGACEMGKQPELALNVRGMVQQGAIPSAITYSEITSTCETGKQL